MDGGIAPGECCTGSLTHEPNAGSGKVVPEPGVDTLYVATASMAAFAITPS